MSVEIVEVDLTKEEKAAILELAEFVICDDNTKADLRNGRKKWIRFTSYGLTQVIGELSYNFNRCDDDNLFNFLDELIGHLECSEAQT